MSSSLFRSLCHPRSSVIWARVPYCPHALLVASCMAPTWRSMYIILGHVFVMSFMTLGYSNIEWAYEKWILSISATVRVTL